MRSNSCPKCGGSMTEGFIADTTYGGHGVSNWYEGPPQKSIWVGVKLSGKTARPIETHRCRRCGFLESYAK
jgi:predicted nucleic-acid-binding Zn-ribbon protein